MLLETILGNLCYLMIAHQVKYSNQAVKNSIIKADKLLQAIDHINILLHRIFL